MDDYPKIGLSQYPWTDPIHVCDPSVGFPSLKNVLDMVWLWTTTMDKLSLIWTPSVAPLSLCHPYHCWLDTWWFFIGWRILQVTCQDDLKLDILDVDTWHNPPVAYQSRRFVLQKYCHMAHSNWFTSFQCPTLLPINRAIPLLPSHISHIFFSDINRPTPCLEVSFHP